MLMTQSTTIQVAYEDTEHHYSEVICEDIFLVPIADGNHKPQLLVGQERNLLHHQTFFPIGNVTLFSSCASFKQTLQFWDGRPCCDLKEEDRVLLHRCAS